MRIELGRATVKVVRVLVVAACAASPALAIAQGAGTYPARPVRMIVPFPPGGGADLTARLVGQKLAERFGQPYVVENRPGSNGVVGIEAAARSAPDGYTFMLVDRGATGINPSLYRKLPYDPNELAYVGITAWGPYVLVVNPSVPAKTLDDLVALARVRPGKLNYGSFGTGSLAQMGMEALKAHRGIDLTHVPYKGAALAATAAVSGEVEVTVSSPAALLGHIREGRLRALAIGAPRRAASLPDVPTLAEAGGGDTLLPTYFGFAFPPGTPAAIVTRTSEEIRRIVALPDVAPRLAGAGLDVDGGTPEEMARVVREDIQRFARLAKTIGLQPE